MPKTRIQRQQILQFLKYNLLVTFVILLLSVPLTKAINCFECDSFDDFTCTEIWDSDLDVNWSFLNNCSHVAGAKYCIKMTGIYQVRKNLLQI